MGGIEIDEPSADLGIALAIATCARDVVVDPQTVIIGEIGLSGEIHPVSTIEKRLNEAVTSGFKKAIIPYANRNIENEKIEIVPVKRLIDAITACISPTT
jgi:DNA repair protein RadA/Sms